MSKLFDVTVKNWFKREWGGSLLLPNGWFGRPYDNQHQLTRFELNNEDWMLLLDNNLSLKFSNLGVVDDKLSELWFTGYEKCLFTWKASDTVKGEELFTFGTVKIIGSPAVSPN